MRQKGIEFVAGAYGVGKSTLCDKLSQVLSIPAYSASELISKVVEEDYGANKFVNDKNLNQAVLINVVNDLGKLHKRFLLSGHFCIINNDNGVEPLPDFVFDSLGIESIILLETDSDIIAQNLHNRDKKQYNERMIRSLLSTERDLAYFTAKKLDCPLLIHKMTFSDIDTRKVVKFLREEVWVSTCEHF